MEGVEGLSIHLVFCSELGGIGAEVARGTVNGLSNYFTFGDAGRVLFGTLGPGDLGVGSGCVG